MIRFHKCGLMYGFVTHFDSPTQNKRYRLLFMRIKPEMQGNTQNTKRTCHLSQISQTGKTAQKREQLEFVGEASC